MPGFLSAAAPKVQSSDVRRLQSQPAMVAKSGPCGFRQGAPVARSPCRKQYGRNTKDPRRLFASKSAGPVRSGLRFKRFRKVSDGFQAQSWKGPQDTAPVRLRAAPPWRPRPIGLGRTQFPASHQARGGGVFPRRCGRRLPEGKDIMPNKMLIDASHPEETGLSSFAVTASKNSISNHRTRSSSKETSISRGSPA